MNARNTLVLVSFTSLAVASVLQADEPVQVQPQQQATLQTQPASPQATPWYAPTRHDRRWQHRQAPHLSQPVTQAQPASQPASAAPSVTTPQAAVTPQPTTLQPTTTSTAPVEARRPSLLERLRSRRAAG